MSEFYIEVDKNDLEYIQKKFRDAPQKANRVFKNAINQTATVVTRKLKKGRSAGYTISAPEFNGEITVQRANAGHLDATVKASGRPRTIKQFKHSVPSSKADVTKSGLKSIVNSAGARLFVSPGGNTEGLIVQRETKGSYPIRVIVSNSVPKMVEKIYEGERGGQGDMQPFIQKTLHDKIREQVAKVI